MPREDKDEDCFETVMTLVTFTTVVITGQNEDCFETVMILVTFMTAVIAATE